MWTFFETLYPKLECAFGDMPESVNTEPVSALYSFIRNNFNIPHEMTNPTDLPTFRNTEIDTFVYRKDTKEIVSIAKLPSSYTDRYGKPETRGFKYHFDWNALRKSNAGVNIITDPNGVFYAEFDAVKKLYAELSSVSADDDDDLFDD